MTINELNALYGGVDCSATQDAVNRYNKVQNRLDTALDDAMKELEAEKLQKQHLENDKIGLKTTK